MIVVEHTEGNVKKGGERVSSEQNGKCVGLEGKCS